MVMRRFTILSHNVFWFQGAPYPGQLPPGPDPGIMEGLVSLYGPVAPDLVCLQEIQSRESFESVSRQLGFPGCFCPGGELTQYGIGVFWRADECRPIANSQNKGAEVQRAWQACEVRIGSNRLRVCNVHLPSDRQLGSERAAVQRIRELEGALSCCDDDGPEVVLGDFNEYPGGSVYRHMVASGYMDAAVAGKAGERPTNLGGERGDQIWIKSGMLEAFRAYGVFDEKACSLSGQDKRFLSDHFPVWITLEL